MIMKKLIMIVVFVVLSNAQSVQSMIENDEAAQGVWYGDGNPKFNIYAWPTGCKSFDTTTFLCPEQFYHAVVHGGTNSSLQAYCTNKPRELYNIILIVEHNPNAEIRQPITVKEENKIEYDLHQFLVNWADGLNVADTYDELYLDQDSTPCFVTEKSATGEFTTTYFSLGKPFFMFKREQFKFMGVTYNKMYCDEKHKLEAEKKISDKPEPKTEPETAPDAVTEESNESNESGSEYTFLLAFLSLIVLVAAIMSVQCCCSGNDHNKKRGLGKQLENENTKVQV